MSGRYQSMTVPVFYPLASPKSPTVGVHRVVLFEEIGPGAHPCHWCARAVSWLPEPGQLRLDTDHLDNDGLNNDPENLVPSCGMCNVKRGVRRCWEELLAERSAPERHGRTS